MILQRYSYCFLLDILFYSILMFISDKLDVHDLADKQLAHKLTIVASYDILFQVVLCNLFDGACIMHGVILPNQIDLGAW